MIKGEPVSKAKVLISDGTKVISEGETGEDGVFQKKIDELIDTNGVSALVIKNGNVASNSLDISGLGLSSGLTSRGYIYTDSELYGFLRSEDFYLIHGYTLFLKVGD